MATLTSHTRSQGSSVVTTVPTEVCRRLGIEAGQDLLWIEDGLGGFRVVPKGPGLAEALEIYEHIRAKYADAFRELAK